MIPNALRMAFESQARGCANLGSPFMGRLMQLFATRQWPEGTVRDRAFAWQGDVSAMGQSIPLRLAGALHALKLQGNTPLAAVYPPENSGDDALWNAVCTVLVEEEAFINSFINSAPQTNEVRRSVALIAAGHWLAARFKMPLQIRELGASAGLNLMWDHFALDLGTTVLGPPSPALTLCPDWLGPLPPPARPRVAGRRGVDLNPLDPDADSLRLRAYLWPDQPERMRITEAAIACQAATVDRGDAVDWLSRQLEPVQRQVRVIYHTIAWQYFPAEAQAKGTALIESTGTAATAHTPLAWLSMEADDVDDGAALTLRLWPGDVTLALGRVDFHGRWVNWTAPPSAPI